MFRIELLLIDDEELERCLLVSDESFEMRILRPSSVIGFIFIGNEPPPLDVVLLVKDVFCLFVDVEVMLGEEPLSLSCLFDCDFFIWLGRFLFVELVSLELAVLITVGLLLIKAAVSTPDEESSFSFFMPGFALLLLLLLTPPLLPVLETTVETVSFLVLLFSDDFP